MNPSLLLLYFDQVPLSSPVVVVGGGDRVRLLHSSSHTIYRAHGVSLEVGHFLKGYKCFEKYKLFSF